MSNSPFFAATHPSTERYDTHVPNPGVQENRFRSQTVARADLPAFEDARHRLPAPFWAGHPAAVDCYWRAWELAFSNLKQPAAESGFPANFCDTAFNGNLFMWDSAFTTCYGIYARRVFDFRKTLDNFYSKQHSDGFICREISETDGQDCFHRFDPSSTGPNILAWVEWCHYLKTADLHRLERVYPVLVAYHQWTRNYRSWPDGSYWSTGWGCGMDNLPRVNTAIHGEWVHGHLAWVDATFQALLSAKSLLLMSKVIGREENTAELQAEAGRLAEFANQYLWNEETAFYFDRAASGELARLNTSGHTGPCWQDASPRTGSRGW